MRNVTVAATFMVLSAFGAASARAELLDNQPTGFTTRQTTLIQAPPAAVTVTPI